MASINRRLAALVCLAGLALLVVCRAAELPAAPSQEGEPDVANSDIGEKAEDGAASLEAGEQQDEDVEEEDGELSSPEEELSWLASQHYEIRQSCDSMNETLSNEIETSEETGAAKKSYEECLNELAEIKKEMRGFVDQIMGGQ